MQHIGRFKKTSEKISHIAITLYIILNKKKTTKLEIKRR